MWLIFPEIISDVEERTSPSRETDRSNDDQDVDESGGDEDAVELIKSAIPSPSKLHELKLPEVVAIKEWVKVYNAKYKSCREGTIGT